MQILAFSDLHGDVATLKLLRDTIKDENYDYVLIAGDLTNADLLPPAKMVKQLKDVFSIMESFKLPYYFVWGTPCREGTIASILRFIENPDEYKVEEQEKTTVLKRQKNNFTEVRRIPKVARNLIKEIETFIKSLSYGRHLGEDKPVKLEKYWLTSSPQNIPENAIFLRHCYRKIIPRALIHLDGHIHFGQRVLNYINLGFLYRDDAHNAPPIVGGYWRLILEKLNVTADFINLGNNMKAFKCVHHPQEGTFYIPYYWKKCPICYEPRQILIKTNRNFKLKPNNESLMSQQL